MRISICVLLSFWVFQCISQNFPQLDSPVKHSIRLSGSFGELRTDHFHSGLDIRSSAGVTGDSIFTIAPGYISRVKIEPSGYGNSIYITHPNGYTSVYAHLQNLRKDIADYVYSKQLENESFLIDQTLADSIFMVNERDYFAQMGNSGKSFGPHLHFEIRNTETDKLFNPILFGIKPGDTRYPIIEQLAIYQYDSLNTLVNEQLIKVKKIAPDSFSIDLDTILLFKDLRTKLSLKCYDRMNGSYNRNGVHSIRVENSEASFSVSHFDSLKFEDSDIYSHFFDRKQKSKNNGNFYQLFIDSLINFSFIKESKIELNARDHAYQLQIQVSDIEGNISKMKIWLSFQKQQKNFNQPLYNFVLYPDKRHLSTHGKFELFLDSSSVASKQAIYVDTGVDTIHQSAAPYISIGESDVIFSRPYSIFYKLDSTQQQDLQKLCLVSYNHKAELENHLSVLYPKYLGASLYNPGSYFIYKDSIPPKITPLFKSKIYKSARPAFSFLISDNLKPASKKLYLQTKASINGKWILMNYDLKNDKITSEIKENLLPGDYNFSIQVSDSQGNTTEYSTMFKILSN